MLRNPKLLHVLLIINFLQKKKYTQKYKLYHNDMENGTKNLWTIHNTSSIIYKWLSMLKATLEHICIVNLKLKL